MDFKGKENANHKLRWLFGHTYLTEPSVQEYIAQVTETDKFIIPCGPLALFLHEWIDLLTNGETECWEEIEGLYPAIPEISDEMKERNHHTYQLFTQGTNGARIVYLEGYKELHRFLTQVLQWPDDSNHTLPQMKEHKDFIMMVNSEKVFYWRKIYANTSVTLLTRCMMPQRLPKRHSACLPSRPNAHRT